MNGGSNSSDLSPLDYQCWSLITSCNRSQKQFQSLKNALQMIWSALPEKAIDNSVKNYHKRLKCVIQTVYILNI